MSLIELKNVFYGYSKGTPFAVQALNGVSFSIEKGELVCVIGHTGSGKSTLMQTMNGLLKPDAGEVLINGKNIHTDKKSVRQARFTVGLCFQYPEYQLFEETCFKDIAFGPKNMGLKEDEIRQRVFTAAQLVGLDESLLEVSPFDLSGGQKRRVAIAGVMAMFPQILILDEPTAGLDPAGRNAVYRMIINYRKKTGAAVLVVTHSMELASRLADRILVMKEGAIALSGTVDEVFSHTDTLLQMGLDVPEVSKITAGLRKKGIELPQNIYTPEQAAEHLSRLLLGGQKP